MHQLNKTIIENIARKTDLSVENRAEFASITQNRNVFGKQPRNLNKKVTLNDIARKLKLSSSTVSRALNGASCVQFKTKESIIKVAYELGFVINNDARELRICGIKNHVNGTKKVTIYDIAKFLQLSASTVSRCYSNSPGVSQITRDKVFATGCEMGYAIQEHAQRLRKTRS